MTRRGKNKVKWGMVNKWTKKAGASESLLAMMSWAIFSLLLVRIYLALTNYPQIGRGTWHISHVLFGGIIMTIGMMVNLMLQGRDVKKVSTAIFGFGFGWFIDEIGKFLTRDYNYFFRPAIIVIYGLFVSMFLFYKYLSRRNKERNSAVLYSVLDDMEEVINDDLEKSEKRKMIKKLKLIISTEKGNLKLMAEGLLKAVREMKVKDDRRNVQLKDWAIKMFNISYDKIFKRTMVVYGLFAYAVYFSIDKIIDILRIGASRQKMEMIQKFYADYSFFGKSDIYMIVFKMMADLGASILFLVGARLFWQGKRTKGMRFFKYGLYVSIFLVSIFKFYFEQFGGLAEVVVAIVLLQVVDRYQKDIRG